MTDDKDLKRLVRQRMAKTGESYTAARAHFRPPPQAASEADPIGELGRRLFTRAGIDQLGMHLKRRYGIDARRIVPLDVGVFRVDCVGARPWITRVHPAARPMGAVEADAALLQHLERVGFPAERCAHREPVSVLEGQGVVVTEHVTGLNGRSDVSGPTLHALGELVGRLHTLPLPPSAREAGAWHHLSLAGGGLDADVRALLPLLMHARSSVAADDRPAYDEILDRLRQVDGCGDLPRALIHPDPCGANAILTPAGDPVLIDWSGAGVGPRVLSFARLVGSSMQGEFGAPPSTELQRVDAIVAGYRKHLRLDDAELSRLAAAIVGPTLVLGCWTLLFQDVPVQGLARSLTALDRMSRSVAERVAAAFDKDEDALTGWFSTPAPQVHPGQGTLL